VDWFSDNPGAVVAGGNIATSIAGGSAHITAHLAGITSNPALVTVGAKVTTGNPVGTTTSTTTTSAVTAHLPMDVQSTLEDVTWSATQVAISQQPAHGVATVTGLVVSYVPDGGFFGQDTVVLQETTKSAQVIQVDPGPVVIGYNVNTNTNTNTVTISVE